MFAYQYTVQLRQMFEHHFEPDGPDFLYRASPRAAPIRITAAERQAFIDDYCRSLQRWWKRMLLAQIPVFGIFVLAWVIATEAVAMTVLILGSLTAVAAFVAAMQKVKQGPARVLRDRVLAGPARTKEEASKATLAKIGWQQIGAAALAGIALPVTIQIKFGSLDGWNRLWVVAAAALLILAAVQAFRKWRVT